MLYGGHCPCFGRRKKDIIERNEEDEKQDENPGLDVTNSEDDIDIDIDIDIDVDVKRKVLAFSYRELASATNSFRQESMIGEGGFGVVYKGRLEKTGQVVAVKKLNHAGLQGDKEFLVEVLMLSLLRHPNLVNLIGYCAEGEQRLLVYEFMPLGSLEDHLHDADLHLNLQPSLDWKTRMLVALGAARGLNFMHNQAHPPVIYRDLKSSNILLDQGFHPKLSDFGLAKFGPGPKDDKSHVSTRVMGTEGYCAPEYASTGKLTIKSDIYSFGVVLLELITGCRPVDTKQKLIDWARPVLNHPKKLVSVADPMLRGQFSEHSFCKAMEVALMCLRDDPRSRPTMNEVVEAMEYIHQELPGPRGGEEEEEERRINQPQPLELEVEETISISDRQRAVEEAKMWGQTCRHNIPQKGKG